MPAEHSADSRTSARASRSPGDAFLIAGMLAGDAAALNKLIERYDRLVRYAIVRASKRRCMQDPQWLDSVASSTWAGFVRSVQRKPHDPPANIRAYLVRIARNQALSAVHGSPPAYESLDADPDGGGRDVAAPLDEARQTLEKLEELEMLRACLAELDADDRMLVSQLSAITDRRWTEAAAGLGLSESTLRSRWDRTLRRLRRCMKGKKAGDSFAPPAGNADS